VSSPLVVQKKEQSPNSRGRLLEIAHVQTKTAYEQQWIYYVYESIGARWGLGAAYPSN
jgi:hypothetical protein